LSTLVLGIETSCDETSAAVVEDGRIVRSNIVASQIAAHAPFGGVVPEIASRQHIRAIRWVVECALQEAGVVTSDLHAVAATCGPGLAGALLVGVNFGRGLALGLDLPLVPVNHLEGHLHSVWLTNKPDEPEPVLPMLALIVSGGHTELVVMHAHGLYERVGHTLDDAAGEAFDKVARLLGLPYPGGPAIQAAATRALEPIRLPRARLPGTFDFSFSGLKTAVLQLAGRLATQSGPEELRGTALPKVDIAGGLTGEQIANIAAGFQESVVEVLCQKTAAAADALGVVSVAVVGGVAANTALQEQMLRIIQQPLYLSPAEFATDNAAMIAAAAYYVPPVEEELDILPNLALGIA